ncbi:hypothetical protein MTO96_015921 [Rhipicephalus appendiculatus]
MHLRLRSGNNVRKPPTLLACHALSERARPSEPIVAGRLLHRFRRALVTFRAAMLLFGRWCARSADPVRQARAPMTRGEILTPHFVARPRLPPSLAPFTFAAFVTAFPPTEPG